MKRATPALAAVLSQLDAAQLRRQRTTVESFASADTRRLRVAGGGELTDFSSNDYLGLARHPALKSAMSECAARCGAGSGASHLVSGHGREHALLEEELAAFTGRERALLFSSGYMANLAVMTVLAGRGERVLLDRLCHSIRQSLRICARILRLHYYRRRCNLRKLRHGQHQISNRPQEYGDN